MHDVLAFLSGWELFGEAESFAEQVFSFESHKHADNDEGKADDRTYLHEKL